jgi:hypothetical protein
VLPPGIQGELAARARFEREAACLDLADAEQAAVHAPAERDLAARLYRSADRHRLLAERLEAGDTSALLEVEPIRPPSSSTA